MNPDVYFVSFMIGIGFTATVLHLIRVRKLREQYALLWLALGTLMIALSPFPSVIDRLAAFFNVVYAPSLLYLLAFVGVLFLLMHMSIALSSLTGRIIKLTQTLAMQEQRIRVLEQEKLRVARSFAREEAGRIELDDRAW
ncbi:hypothetical protein B1A99_28095 [Cohnella sp. CIP 111063]|uniref:DUF2304 domain-containing protein n=1 Tax=unclassified Cohnella TaxID=2636738 RepID=UPI000B8BB3ED|nr:MULTISPECIES: DUF2304 domain-containing protein [unclassified Cohnella]OXS54094.1 hypothetical protein B1A99_28095 [Cohnella sp. CIP 111063]PRX62973.1 hypothetical protein B0G52_122126 [Cohnella sp. SGD-V74]